MACANPQLVKTLLQCLREGRIYIARVKRGGKGGKYAYLSPPLELLKLIGAKPGDRFRVVVDEDHVDYVLDENGDYALTYSKGAVIRFPVDTVRGHIVIEPLPRGFRVYF